jgi:hypothetical protein
VFRERPAEEGGSAMNLAIDTIILDLPSLIRPAFLALFFARSVFSLRWLRLANLSGAYAA